jgi:hypothetical protein
MPYMNRLKTHFSEHALDGLLGKIDGWQYGAEPQKIARISVRYFRGKINVKPVLKPNIDQFKKTPVSARNNDEKWQLSVDNEKTFIF